MTRLLPRTPLFLMPPRLAAVIAVALALAGCWGGKDAREELRSGAEVLYERAAKSMNNGNYRNAITYYEALEARFPFSNQARQAQLDLIYCYYKNGEPESAIDAAVQFERENPTHPRVDYALYMKGLAQFRGQRNFFHRWFGVDLAKRPPVEAREAFSAFRQLIKRYPDSPYAPDARQRMIFLRNRLANHENHVADYYMRRGADVAALNRAKYSLENFPGAPAAARSMQIIVKAYQKLGMQDLADDARRVLEMNYPTVKAPERDEDKKRFFFF